MHKERLLKLARYLREVDIPDWDFGDSSRCAFAHFDKAFAGEDEDKFALTFLDITRKEEEKLFYTTDRHRRGVLHSSATKEAVAQNIEDFANEVGIYKKTELED